MQQALDALNGGLYRSDSVVKAIEALKAELAKPEQEPEPEQEVRWFQQFGDAPPRKPWQGLTIKDIVNARIECGANDRELPFVFCYAIEAKLKEKNI
jgi:hypothetical protein